MQSLGVKVEAILNVNAYYSVKKLATITASHQSTD